ncbi:hypothetical protein ACHAXS_008773 [Conticribra weissflogii]
MGGGATIMIARTGPSIAFARKCTAFWFLLSTLLSPNIRSLAFGPSSMHEGNCFTSNKPFHSSTKLMEWKSGTYLLDFDPQTLSSKGGNEPQIAKDLEYASAILKAWREDLESRPESASVNAPFMYKCRSDGSSLYGHIYRCSEPQHMKECDEELLPGVIIFHTGAGPQDIFLRWKAESLVNDKSTFGDKGCVVLIADIIGDADGWAWYDRPRYEWVRESILVPDENGERNNLKCRVQAAIDAICAQPGVNAKKIGAMGFCLGGHPILELARMKLPAVRLLTTFHGVFDGVRKLSPVKPSLDENCDSNCEILVCTGTNDPFVHVEDLDAARDMFNDLGYNCRVMELDGTRHGFTNPAQQFNPSPAFEYNTESCNFAWSATLKLLQSKLGS